MDEEMRKEFNALVKSFISLNSQLVLQLSKCNLCNQTALHEIRENIISLNDITRGR